MAAKYARTQTYVGQSSRSPVHSKQHTPEGAVKRSNGFGDVHQASHQKTPELPAKP